MSPSPWSTGRSKHVSRSEVKDAHGQMPDGVSLQDTVDAFKQKWYSIDGYDDRHQKQRVETKKIEVQRQEQQEMSGWDKFSKGVEKWAGTAAFHLAWAAASAIELPARWFHQAGLAGHWLANKVTGKTWGYPEYESPTERISFWPEWSGIEKKQGETAAEYLHKFANKGEEYYDDTYGISSSWSGRIGEFLGEAFLVAAASLPTAWLLGGWWAAASAGAGASAWAKVWLWQAMRQWAVQGVKFGAVDGALGDIADDGKLTIVWPTVGAVLGGGIWWAVPAIVRWAQVINPKNRQNFFKRKAIKAKFQPHEITSIQNMQVDDFAKLIDVAEDYAQDISKDDVFLHLDKQALKWVDETLIPQKQKVGKAIGEMRDTIASKGNDIPVDAISIQKKFDDILAEYDARRSYNRKAQRWFFKASHKMWHNMDDMTQEVMEHVGKKIERMKHGGASMDDALKIVDSINDVYDDALTKKRWGIFNATNADKTLKRHLDQMRNEVTDQLADSMEQLSPWAWEQFRALRKQYSELLNKEGRYRTFLEKAIPGVKWERVETMRWFKKIFSPDSAQAKNVMRELSEDTGKDRFAMTNAAKFIGQQTNDPNVTNLLANTLEKAKLVEKAPGVGQWIRAIRERWWAFGWSQDYKKLSTYLIENGVPDQIVNGKPLAEDVATKLMTMLPQRFARLERSKEESIDDLIVAAQR